MRYPCSNRDVAKVFYLERLGSDRAILKRLALLVRHLGLGALDQDIASHPNGGSQAGNGTKGLPNIGSASLEARALPRSMPSALATPAP
ncbi:hypothetical protein ACMYR2_2613 [Nitrobacter sp. TKz-YC01]